MDTTKYPLGIQSFPKLIEGGFAYVDKTSFIAPLVKREGYYFLTRPRRFGKSLLLSTIHAYFEGRRELFKGLAIDALDVDWTPRPVLHFDLNAEDYSKPHALERILDSLLRQYEALYGKDAADVTPAQRFRTLIRNAHDKTGQKVAVLVAEYDKPLLGLEDEKLFEQSQNLLKGFFGMLKSMDEYLCFGMFTGVARFNKISIFSDLNNLSDISLDAAVAEICGWTREELTTTFSVGIAALAEAAGATPEEMMKRMQTMYDGYLFAPEGHRLYNPFSVLSALQSKRLRYYWFQSGTPTFLVKRVRKTGILLPSLNSCRAYESQLLATNIHDRNPIPLLFQTGYLTIKEADGEIYTLGFPNQEVKVGFAQHLQPLYLPQMNDLNGIFSVVEFQQNLLEGEPEEFMRRIQAMVKDIPYEQQDERLYQNLVYLLFVLIGADARMEEHTGNGRTDLVVRTPDYIYVFEFKFNRSASEALQQIRDRDYAGRHALDRRITYMIGANFSDHAPERGLTGWLIEKLGTI